MGLGFDALKFQYQYLARIMNIGPKGQIYANVERTELRFDILLDLEDFTFYLQNFKIGKIGKINVSFKGNPLTDWLVNPVVGVVTGIFKGLITGVVSATVENILEGVLNEINNRPPPSPMVQGIL
ncbi:uncharacterized protein LOC113371266 [Ctenocephalides felis]|uniref:uncharacterized protein LOC113371266 n=1 Tax=Ctenocephalides felis TaxID=7515 RepID=UPI000E6E4192|nr:uncharacterized protein LOC113371266 [Ctenocephalides felis]